HSPGGRRHAVRDRRQPELRSQRGRRGRACGPRRRDVVPRGDRDHRERGAGTRCAGKTGSLGMSAEKARVAVRDVKASDRAHIVEMLELDTFVREEVDVAMELVDSAIDGDSDDYVVRIAVEEG